MKRLLRVLVAACCALYVVACVNNSSSSVSGVADNNIGNAKYVFYFIGDGMAATQVRLAEAALSSPKFQSRYAKVTQNSEIIDELNIKSLDVTGLATSNAHNRYITDSAAAGTALATGEKTNVGMISQTPDGKPLKTIAEMAKERGMKVGIISSVSLDHATPACFYAHAKSRNEYTNISDQMMESGFDYFAGGSLKWDRRAKDLDLDKALAYEAYVSDAELRGLSLCSTKEQFDRIGAGSQEVFATLHMLGKEQYTGDGSAMPYTIDLERYSPENRISLAQFTATGIEVLDGDEGFFMMVEGGKIDWACHANDAATVAYEVVAFDEAIGVAMEFAQKHPDETLIVVTGDHDCGGLTIGFAGTGYQSAFDLLAGANISYTEFASEVRSKIERGETFEALLKFACDEYGFTNDIIDGSEGVINQTAELSDYEVSKLREAYMKSAKRAEFDDRDKYNAAYNGYDPFTTTCTHILNNKAGIDFASYSHTAVPVMVFAEGAGAGLFSGYYDNTDIAKKIIEAAGL